MRRYVGHKIWLIEKTDAKTMYPSLKEQLDDLALLPGVSSRRSSW